MVVLSGSMARSGHRGCCYVLHLREDNARFILLFVVLGIYMITGAILFMILEQDNEVLEKQVYTDRLNSFLRAYPSINRTDFDAILKVHAEAESAGFAGTKRPRWDFPGSFYFVGTVVSTIGFGMTTPRTVAGKIVLIFYGFFGCAGTILFFNLFLERIITFLAYILRSIHERDLKRKGLTNGSNDSRRGSQVSDDDRLDTWKPSVYWVMLILFLGAVIVACCASAMYHPVEDWTYFEAIYFCFVTFATIGFGDYVVSQKESYPNVHLYRFGNFIFIVIGCCCIYSLFNVASIVIKQLLNWIIKKLNCRCRRRKKSKGRRNAITPGHIHRGSKMNKSKAVTVECDSDSDGRRNSDEMISMRDFLQANKISLAMMQKQLWETSQRGMNSSNGSGFQGPVGPLAILNRKLGQEEV
ncbi:potassium channel subfamily K member 12-like [Mizuhopecten yessoensis]|uniref:Potassium channel subfamily K member 12 n=1 Tax=Mizuhopecten yessoensis TaxID=6573 RepID=A0A210QAD6_MIZYE|nr:potassium channel subfamily K member 12-like [Mizuhopecten yessoensis]OWF45696.1 Potassium channel subfamily K member 12 [Mizuhopecten yessoensis]